jgi:hypothetical protein
MLGSTEALLTACQIWLRRFSSVYPDYRERVLRHEAAHLLAGYLFGVPVTGYSLDLGDCRGSLRKFQHAHMSSSLSRPRQSWSMDSKCWLFNAPDDDDDAASSNQP